MCVILQIVDNKAVGLLVKFIDIYDLISHKQNCFCSTKHVCHVYFLQKQG